VSLVVHAARMGYRGVDYLDVSLQGNMRRADAGEVGGHRGIGLAFCPSPGLLYPYISKRKFGRLQPSDWPVYREAYLAEMRQSYRTARVAWDALLALPEVTLLCFCTDPAECHRTVLGGILAKLGAEVRGERPPAAPAARPATAGHTGEGGSTLGLLARVAPHLLPICSTGPAVLGLACPCCRKALRRADVWYDCKCFQAGRKKTCATCKLPKAEQDAAIAATLREWGWDKNPSPGMRDYLTPGWR
jgi:hypothetical protein